MNLHKVVNDLVDCYPKSNKSCFSLVIHDANRCGFALLARVDRARRHCGRVREGDGSHSSLLGLQLVRQPQPTARVQHDRRHGLGRPPRQGIHRGIRRLLTFGISSKFDYKIHILRKAYQRHFFLTSNVSYFPIYNYKAGRGTGQIDFMCVKITRPNQMKCAIWA